MEEKIVHPTLFKQALKLEYLTIVWNVFEGLTCITLGMMSGSIVLLGYGLESGVEVFASSVVVWELKGTTAKRTQKALKMIGIAYFVVSGYIFLDAMQSLLQGDQPHRSLGGVLFMTITAIVMLTLGLYKRKVGKKLQSLTVLADAKFTLIDAALASAVLVGLGANVLFGWWWMDQAMALFLSGVAFREGLKELFT